jgi:glutamyl/glutaminyl-tRNA synthetase
MITRFAPSPTGELHLGHVLHALWVWRVAAERGAKVLIRMEDHDRTRCRPEYELSILEDLEWLGFVPDAISRSSLNSRPSPYRQSDNP